MFATLQVDVTLNGGLEKAAEQEGERPKMSINVLSGYGRRDPARYMRVRLEDVATGELYVSQLYHVVHYMCLSYSFVIFGKEKQIDSLIPLSAQEKRLDAVHSGLAATEDLGELGEMGRGSQDKTTVIGRVCCEAEGKVCNSSLCI